MTNTSPARKTTAEPEPWLTVRQAAIALDCAPQTVYSKALKGEIETTRMAGRTFVSRASVERALESAGA